MSDSDSDEDLKRAIALSLQQTSKPEPSGIKAEIIDLLSDEDDEDDDLDAPLSTNKFAKQTSTSGLSAVSVSTTSTHTVPTQETQTSGLLGLDRKKMEEERLARANRKKPVQDVSTAARSTKRKVSISSPTAEDDRKVKPKLSKTPLHSAARHQRIDGVSSNDIEALSFHGSMIVPPRIPQQNETKGSTPETLSFNQQEALGASGIQYPDGVVKKTWVSLILPFISHVALVELGAIRHAFRVTESRTEYSQPDYGDVPQGSREAHGPQNILLIKFDRCMDALVKAKT
jgi:hypothetical protein